MITTINEWTHSQLQSELEQNGKLISQLSDITLVNKEINIDNLKVFARGLMQLCLGEYGDTYYNPNTNKIFVCLGDANPFESDETLAEWISSNVGLATPLYKSIDLEDIEIEHEAGPPDDEGWLIYDFKLKEFITYTY